MVSWCQYNQISFVHLWDFGLKNGWEKVLDARYSAHYGKAEEDEEIDICMLKYELNSSPNENFRVD